LKGECHLTIELRHLSIVVAAMRELSTRGAFLAWFLDIGQFTPHEREYDVEVCNASSAWDSRYTLPSPECRIERCRDGAELRPASRRREILLAHPVDGCHAEGMTHVEDEQILSAVTINSPKAVTGLIEQRAGSGARDTQKRQRFPRYHHSPLPRRRHDRHEST
jgi:hypothetical protein